MIHTPEKIAFELWCIQEQRLQEKRPLEHLDDLLVELQRRYPELEPEMIDQGIQQFAELWLRMARTGWV